MPTFRTAATCVPLLLALAACDQPGPLSKKAAEPAQPPPAAAAPGIPPRPVPPAWAIPLLSKPLAESFPATAKCVGAVDGLGTRYVDARAITGWGWDEAGQKPVARVVAINRKGLMVGFGEGGEPRPDVPGQAAQVRSDRTGWTLVTIAPAMNGVRIYGIDPATRAACLLGEVASVPG